MGATAGFLALGAFAGGTAMTAVSQRASGRINQQIANQNARFAEAQAQDAERRGVEDEALLRERIRGAIGTARAAYASQGVDVNIGSAVDVQSSIAYQGERDALAIRNNAAREAWGYRVDAWNSRVGGALARMRGNNESVRTVLDAAGTYYKVYRGGGRR